MSLFTDLMAKATSYEQGHANVDSIEAAYSGLSPKDRLAFMTEARQYIADHHLKAHMNAPAYDAGVFVYQAAVIAEINEMERRHDKSPEAEAIRHSKTYQDFLTFRGNHAHPEGIYGKFTDGLESNADCRDCLVKIMQQNADAYERAKDVEKRKDGPVVDHHAIAEKKPVTTATASATSKPIQQSPAVAPAPESDRKTEKSLYLEQSNDFGNTSNRFQSGAGRGAVSDNNATNIFESHTNAHYNTTGVAAGINIEKIRPNDKTIFKLGAALKNTTVVDSDNNVSVKELKSITSVPAPTYFQPNFVNQNSTYTGKHALLSQTTFAGVTAGVEEHFKLGDNSPTFMAGGSLGVGMVTTKVQADDIRNSSVTYNNVIPPQGNEITSLPQNMKQTHFGLSHTLMVGIDQTDKLPGVKLEQNGVIDPANLSTVGLSTTQTNALKLTAFKSFPLGKNGATINVEAGANTTHAYVDKEGNQGVLSYVNSGTDGGHGLKVGPTVQVGVKIPLR